MEKKKEEAKWVSAVGGDDEGKDKLRATLSNKKREKTLGEEEKKTK